MPGNHEFDFGKATFEQRMAEAKFPLFAANLRGPDGAPLAGFKDNAIVNIDGVRIGLTGETYDDAARASTPEDLRFAPTVATAKDQAEALRREGADFVVAVVHADRQQDYALMATHAIDLVLSGHDHDLFLEFDGRNAIVESSFDAHYVTAIDVTIEVKAARRPPRRDMVAAIPHHRHCDRDAGPGTHGRGRGIHQGIHARDGRAARHHRGGARRPRRDAAHARGRGRRAGR